MDSAKEETNVFQEELDFFRNTVSHLETHRLSDGTIPLTQEDFNVIQFYQDEQIKSFNDKIKGMPPALLSEHFVNINAIYFLDRQVHDLVSQAVLMDTLFYDPSEHDWAIKYRPCV